MTTTLTPREQDLTYLFTTALEGGIGFFSYALNYTWDAPFAEQGADLVPEDPSEAEDWAEIFKAAGIEYRMEEVVTWSGTYTLPCVRLTTAMMGTGLGRLSKDNPRRRTQCGSTFLALSMSLGKDCEDYDSIDASIIAQFALGLVTKHDDGHLSEIYG